MARGTVEFFKESGGCGRGVFFYIEDIGGPDLEEGQAVEFDTEQAQVSAGEEPETAVAG